MLDAVDGNDEIMRFVGNLRPGIKAKYTLVRTIPELLWSRHRNIHAAVCNGVISLAIDASGYTAGHPFFFGTK